MGAKGSIALSKEDIENLQQETGFTHNQILRLYSRFVNLDKSGSGTLTREDFLHIPELAINPLGDRIVHAFFYDGDADGVKFNHFLKTLARFRAIDKKKDSEAAVNSRIEKLKFAFRMYDIDGDDKISREELLEVLHMMVGVNISDEQLGSIADRTIVEADKDSDGMISFDEFCKVMEKVDVELKMSIRFLN